MATWSKDALDALKALLMVIALAIALSHTAHSADIGTASSDRVKSTTETSSQRTNAMKIRMTVNGRALTASLEEILLPRSRNYAAWNVHSPKAGTDTQVSY